jgi:chaperonin GroES
MSSLLAEAQSADIEYKEEGSYLSIEEIVNSPNVAELLDEQERSRIASEVLSGFYRDLDSRREWDERMAEATKLALQVMEEKTFPWPNASNVKFPLLTIAALQYHSRAYPALVSGTDIVKARVFGEDPDGSKTARAERISAHMSFQLLEEDENWEDQTDKSLLVQAILGCVFKKSYFDVTKGHNVSEMVLPKDLVVSYWTKSLETSPRISHIIEMSGNEILERIGRGLFLETDLSRKPGPSTRVDNQGIARDEAQGVTPSLEDPFRPYRIIEQSTYLDLDGDGYKEPYVVTVREDTAELLRIVPRFFKEDIVRKKGRIIHITPMHYYTKYSFIPSPDGGFYDLGLGVLLGPINESINTLINQLIDAGTLANTRGGFLGRGVKFRSGENTFKPFEWKRVDSTGDDLRKSIFPLPVGEPSPVLFQLLSLLVNYGERIVGATDVMVGVSPGQNTPAETTRHVVEQGMKVFSGIFKRTYRAMKEEFRKLYILNRLYLNADTAFQNLSTGQGMLISPDDYIDPPTIIRPAADPDIVSNAQKIMRAQAVLEAAKMFPGYNLYEANKMYLRALQVPGIEVIYPDPNGPNAVPPIPNPKVVVEQLKQETKQKELQLKMQETLLKLQQDAELNQAKILQLQAQAIKLLAEAQGVETGHQIALIEAEIGAAKQHNERIMHMIDTIRELAIASANYEQRMAGMETASSNKGSVGALGQTSPRNS